MEQRKLTDENLTVLAELGYVRPPAEYVESPVPSNFTGFLKSQGAGPALVVWTAVPGSYICGGAVRAYHNRQADLGDDTVRDVDMYFNGAEALKKAGDILTALGLTEVDSTERSRTFLNGDDPVIQLVKFVYGTLENVLNEFDYTIVKAGASSDVMLKYKNYDVDLKNRVLHYYGSRLPMSSMHRALKYAGYGYRLPARDMVALLMDINRTVDFNDALSVVYHVTAFDPLNAQNGDGFDIDVSDQPEDGGGVVRFRWAVNLPGLKTAA